MGSKGRVPPPHMRRSMPGPGMLHPDPFGPGIHPTPGAFSFDMLPPPEIMEQKLAAQHMEMQRIATENQRFVATHSSLRQELAAAHQELQRLQGHMGAINAEQDQQLRGLLDKIAKMEADLKASESVKTELQQAHGEAQNLVAARQELVSKVQQLTQDLQRNHSDVKLVPSLVSDLEGLRQEYQNCRVTFDYERKLRIDHYESLQVMEKNYVSMVREVEKLRAELTNATNVDRSVINPLGWQFGANVSAYKENDTSGHHPVGQNAYEDGYGAPQGRGPSGGAAPYSAGAAGSASAQAAYDSSRGHAYDASRASGYDFSRGTGYDAARGGSYDGPRGAGTPMASGYEGPRGAGMGQATAVTGNASSAAAPYGSAQAPSYGAAAAPATYGSIQQATYGSGQTHTAYGFTQQTTYGSGQAPTAYGSTTQQSAYAPVQTPTRPGGSYEGPRGGNTARR